MSKIWTSSQHYEIIAVKQKATGQFVKHLKLGDVLKFYIPIYSGGSGRTGRGSVRAAPIKVTCVNTGDFNYYTGNGIAIIFRNFDLKAIG